MQNCIEHIVGLESLQQLEIIDLADNLVKFDDYTLTKCYYLFQICL